MFGNWLGMMRPGGFVNGGGMIGGGMRTGPVADAMGGQEPPMATFPGTADPKQGMPPEQTNGFMPSPMRGGGMRTPPMGGGFMGGGFGGGMFRSPFGGFGNWGGGFSRPLFPSLGAPPMMGGFGGGLSPSAMSMNNYMNSLMQPFSFGFQPPQMGQPQQPQQPQMPQPNIGQPPMDVHSMFGNN
jgi:hypothetical protein